MNRAEARRRLEGCTRFQFVRGCVVVRDVALLAALEREGEAARPAVTGNHPIDHEHARVLAA